MFLMLLIVVTAGIALARGVHRSHWAEGARIGRAHLSIAWSLVVLGAVHITATAFVFRSVSEGALWFASGGIAMVLGGLLNVLQRLYAPAAPGISPVCIAANVALTALASAFVVKAGARVVSDPQYLMLLALLVAGTLISMRVPQPR